MRNRTLKATALSVTLVLLITVFLSSCSFSRTPIVHVNDVSIDDEIYLYYLDFVNTDKNLLNENETSTDTAARLVQEYIVVNSQFKEQELTLSDAAKMSVSSRVNNLWHIYEAYYTKNGISKQTLIKVHESNAYKTALFLHVYDKDGEREVADDAIRTAFKDNYVIFYTLSELLVEVDDLGRSSEMSSDKKELLAKRFTAMADRINTGTTFLDIFADYESEGSANTPNISVTSKSSTNYPVEFFKQVQELSDNAAKAFHIEPYQFLVQKLPYDTENDIYFKMYRADCLMTLKMDEFEKDYMNKWSQDYVLKFDLEMAKTIAGGLIRNEKPQPTTSTSSEQITTTTEATTAEPIEDDE